VLDSQSFLATQGDRLAVVSGQVGTNLVATYKALGGGWQSRQNAKIISEKNRNEMMERTSLGICSIRKRSKRRMKIKPARMIGGDRTGEQLAWQ